MDIFTIKDKDYLCTVDYYSDVFEVDNLYGKKDNKTVTRILKRHFSNHGIPEIIFTDNGPPFSSSDFAKFASDYQFEHITSSPGHPQSNGKVENSVKTAKALIIKTEADKGDFYLNLLNWRNTPTEGMNSSPAQRLYSRRTRTLLPTKSSLFQPKVVQNVRSQKKKQKDKQKRYFDRETKNLPELKRGDTVRIKPFGSHKTWQKGQVQSKDNIRSYKIKTEDGRTYRRNRRHLRLRKEPFITQEELELDQQYNPPSFSNTPRDRPMNKQNQEESHPEPQSSNMPSEQSVVRRSSRPKKPKRDEDFIYDY